MRTSFEVIVVGLGAMGSAVACELARRGVRVLGLDAHDPPHTLGSTHGRSRIIREAYFEDPAYVPLLRRAYQRWDALAREATTMLFVRTGGLMIGPSEGVVLRGARASALAHGIAHEVLDAAEVRRAWPVVQPADDMIALLEPGAGVLFPEKCVAAHLALAHAHGAALETGVRVVGWSAQDDDITVTLADGSRRRAHRLVLAAGPWMPELLDLGLGLEVERQLSHWLEPVAEPEAFGADRLPITLWDDGGRRYFYTMPDLGDGVKAGIHHEGERTTAATVRREATPGDEAAVRELLARFMPAANGRLREARVCLYTNTSDGHFVLDHHPLHRNVIIASACSGHGFKFASVIGEVVANLVTSVPNDFDLRLFGVERLLASPSRRFARTGEGPDIP